MKIQQKKIHISCSRKPAHTMRDGGTSCDVTNNNEWKNSIHKTKKQGYSIFYYQFLQNTFYVLLNDNIFPHLIKKKPCLF